ncbi:tetratricopeptide repeat protein [Sporolactobacillus sp. THM7-4]|nr:tetratricopeptide repeat protein [Sporolactobacillus sp. THM7-4]
MRQKLVETIRAACRLIDSENGKQGMDQLRDLWSQNPDQGEVFLEVALELDKRSMEDEAIPLYVKALELDLPDEKEWIALACLASSYRNIGDYVNALKTINHARKKYHSHPVIECFYSLILLDSKKCTEAVRTLGMTLLREADPNVFNGFREALESKFSELGADH